MFETQSSGDGNLNDAEGVDVNGDRQVFYYRAREFQLDHFPSDSIHVRNTLMSRIQHDTRIFPSPDLRPEARL